MSTPKLLPDIPSTPASSSSHFSLPQTPITAPFTASEPLFMSFSTAEDLRSPLVDSLGLDTMSLDSPFVPSVLDQGLQHGNVKKSRKAGHTSQEKTKSILQVLDQEYSMSIWELVEHVLTMSAFEYHVAGLYRQDSRRIDRILDALWNTGPIRNRMEGWMEPIALDTVSSQINSELQAVKSKFYFYAHQVTPEILQEYNFCTEMKVVRDASPAWNQVIQAATDCWGKPEQYKLNSLVHSPLVSCLIESELM
ncbi:hypothetical protein PM082_002098 [Marasmius tenuissimus]|nr:hypothetical protein PM082_002098 [Marasmius tenuissimus]